jgi:hypothetical protein
LPSQGDWEIRTNDVTTPHAMPKTTAKKIAKKVFMGAKPISLGRLLLIYAQLFITIAGDQRPPEQLQFYISMWLCSQISNLVSS